MPHCFHPLRLFSHGQSRFVASLLSVLVGAFLCSCSSTQSSRLAPGYSASQWQTPLETEKGASKLLSMIKRPFKALRGNSPDTENPRPSNFGFSHNDESNRQSFGKKFLNLVKAPVKTLRRGGRVEQEQIAAQATAPAMAGQPGTDALNLMYNDWLKSKQAGDDTFWDRAQENYLQDHSFDDEGWQQGYQDDRQLAKVDRSWNAAALPPVSPGEWSDIPVPSITEEIESMLPRPSVYSPLFPTEELPTVEAATPTVDSTLTQNAATTPKTTTPSQPAQTQTSSADPDQINTPAPTAPMADVWHQSSASHNQSAPDGQSPAGFVVVWDADEDSDLETQTKRSTNSDAIPTEVEEQGHEPVKADLALAPEFASVEGVVPFINLPEFVQDPEVETRDPSELQPNYLLEIEGLRSSGEELSDRALTVVDPEPVTAAGFSNELASQTGDLNINPKPFVQVFPIASKVGINSVWRFDLDPLGESLPASQFDDIKDQAEEFVNADELFEEADYE